jgi:AbrB family looped-hinge helix DNA binding protein
MINIDIDQYDTKEMSAEFESTLVKWGNSVGLALPKPIRDGMKLQPGDKLRIILQNNKISIEKIK